MAGQGYAGKVVIPECRHSGALAGHHPQQGERRHGLSEGREQGHCGDGRDRAQRPDLGAQARGLCAIVTGQAAVGAGWNARAQVNSQTSGGKLKATIPQEGTVFQINTINLVANGPGGDAAKTFVNYA